MSPRVECIEQKVLTYNILGLSGAQLQTIRSALAACTGRYSPPSSSFIAEAKEVYDKICTTQDYRGYPVDRD